MKNLALVFALFVILLASCKKENDKAADQAPAWLRTEFETALSGLEQSGSSEQQLCEISVVEVYQLNGKVYYNLYCQLWSCYFCHLYDENGVKVNWGQEEWSDFDLNKKLVKTIPACDLQLES